MVAYITCSNKIQKYTFEREGREIVSTKIDSLTRFPPFPYAELSHADSYKDAQFLRKNSRIQRELIFSRLSVNASYPLKEPCISIAVFKWYQSPRRADNIATLCGYFLFTKAIVHFHNIRVTYPGTRGGLMHTQLTSSFLADSQLCLARYYTAPFCFAKWLISVAFWW